MSHSFPSGYILGTDSFGEEAHRELSVSRQKPAVLRGAVAPKKRLAAEEENVRLLLKNIGTAALGSTATGVL